MFTTWLDINARMSKHVDLGNTRLRREGATAFFLAAHSADAELLRVLLEQGADPEIPNEKGTTPLMAAAGIGARSPGEDAGTLEEVHEVVEFLLNLGADVSFVGVGKRGEARISARARSQLVEKGLHLGRDILPKVAAIIGGDAGGHAAAAGANGVRDDALDEALDACVKVTSKFIRDLP